MCISSNADFLKDILPIMLGGFFGALFATLFTLAYDKFKSSNQERLDRISALIRLQFMLNNNIDDISLNINQIDEICYDPTDPVKIRSQFLNLLAIDDELFIKTSNNKIANEMYSYNLEIKRLNRTIVNEKELYTVFRDSFMQGSINSDIYRNNYKFYVDILKTLKPFFENITHKSIRILAMIRLYLDAEKKIRSKWLKMKQSDSILSEDKITLMIEKLNTELNKIQKESANEIDKITKTPQTKENPK